MARLAHAPHVSWDWSELTLNGLARALEGCLAQACMSTSASARSGSCQGSPQPPAQPWAAAISAWDQQAPELCALQRLPWSGHSGNMDGVTTGMRARPTHGGCLMPLTAGARVKAGSQEHRRRRGEVWANLTCVGDVSNLPRILQEAYS